MVPSTDSDDCVISDVFSVVVDALAGEADVIGPGDK